MIERFASRVIAVIDHWFRAVMHDANLSIERDLARPGFYMPASEEIATD